MKRVSTRTVLVVGLLVVLVLAGFVSYYASSSPDGLNRVAADHGFSSAQEQHRAEQGPFAGYETKGLDDGRLSGGLAGVVGTVVVLVVAGGLTFALRRRRTSDQPRELVDERER
ncbi:MAG: hypothetical protein HOQ22_08490 [Nocardioidaceae bacterium]|nr:hypothetical protein [Nocardioidaceae bacterium]NUS51058.1 hypothetical protein [Nocardioidaceae bacterium]